MARAAIKYTPNLWVVGICEIQFGSVSLESLLYLPLHAKWDSTAISISSCSFSSPNLSYPSMANPCYYMKRITRLRKRQLPTRIRFLLLACNGHPVGDWEQTPASVAHRRSSRTDHKHTSWTLVPRTSPMLPVSQFCRFFSSACACESRSRPMPPAHS